MNFFEHQEAARRRTRLMVALYLVAVVAVVLAVDAVLSIAWSWNTMVLPYDSRLAPVIWRMFAGAPAAVHVAGVTGTLAVILGVTLVQIWKLGGGGAAVADMMGGRRLGASRATVDERRLLNVVEEMAIASGVRVPAVFLLDDERAINAFAAGNSVSNAAIIVTRGALESFNRDELQGVIGHEFSHILNGDMQLNLRLLGILAGIVFIGSIGRFLLNNSRSRDSRGTGGPVLLGLALFIIGYVGLFFARLIKAAVSRQREFLSDASSVQFTRNPDGIAGALDRIRTSAVGTQVGNRYAEDMAHMFFGQGMPFFFGSLFNTHPPIDERIRRVSPGFQASAYRSQRAASVEVTDSLGGVEAIRDSADGYAAPVDAVAALAGPTPHAASGHRRGDRQIAWGRTPVESLALVGSLENAHVDRARRWIDRLPPNLRARLDNPQGASAVVPVLLLAPAGPVRDAQLKALRDVGGETLASDAMACADELQAVSRDSDMRHIGLLDLALPALRLLSSDQRFRLLAGLEAVIQADRRVSLLEFALLTLVTEQLAQRASYDSPRFRRLDEVRDDAAIALALCAYAGAGDPAATARAYQRGCQVMDVAWGLPARPALQLDAVRSSLERLRGLAPMPKAVLIKGVFATVTADGGIRLAEAVLLRMLGAVLDCPLPPLVSEGYDNK